VFKDLLVHIPTERSPRPAIDASVSLAMNTGAHLDAIATGYASTSTNVPFVAEGGAAVAASLQFEYESAMERAEAAMRVFETEAKHARINYGKYVLSGMSAEIIARVDAAARLYDLTIVSQEDPDRDTFDNRLPQELLLQTGGPLLLIPYTFHGAFRAARIGICWDGSRLAARAMRDAMPFITKADALTTITINESGVPVDASPEQLARHLARRGLRTKTVFLPSERGNLQASILSIAADEDLDLLVMGGYGHSRLQETVFGGVTREMFHCMTVPVVMSH
jgi:nucleotide-binding universal stress UspA family protein